MVIDSIHFEEILLTDRHGMLKRGVVIQIIAAEYLSVFAKVTWNIA